MTSTANVTPAKAIMVVDDESDIVVIFRKSLEFAGYAVFAFTDPLIALEHLKTNADRYGLVISDMRMPKMSGIEFAAQVRSVNPSITMILMSAFSLKDLEISPDLKISELLQKPVTPGQLKAIVSKYIAVMPNSKTSYA